jgi:very-short-patch-repair endonuclease
VGALCEKALSELSDRGHPEAQEEIPAEEIVGRKITVVDARTFQGKERDIMLMSMVATPDQKTTSTGSTYDQRFNVAASRARDRMYLFRSVEFSELSKSDLKAKLIGHFAAPFREDPVKISNLRELCQSGFEREMFDLLVGKGYRVRPQIKAGAYSIDLVIEGEEDRPLAIECDGDRYHGSEKWSTDMARQRVLERARWNFWRCFASSFTLNREAVLKRLGCNP